MKSMNLYLYPYTHIYHNLPAVGTTPGAHRPAPPANSPLPPAWRGGRSGPIVFCLVLNGCVIVLIDIFFWVVIVWRGGRSGPIVVV